ncbi:MULTISPECIES: hypothetical protein [unclassified Tychonema]|uniref:hypothetical protein n=1 Tax=unclassified Tychonema TaxID=2642144 RepID=UPI001D146F02|nr:MULTISPECIES: hypothetical protein [unclassified Tychonema]
MTRHLLKANCKTVHLGGFSPNLEFDRTDIEIYSGYDVADNVQPEFLTPELLRYLSKFASQPQSRDKETAKLTILRWKPR